MLRESGDLQGDPKPITHAVKFYEKGDRPLEIITSRQWFIRTSDVKDRLLARGGELEWHPDYMRHRYENWVNGLTGDWNITRQRFFGVPFPVWYPLSASGEPDYTSPLLPSEDELPIDPVCRMTVAPEHSAGHLSHEGVGYFFCSLECASAFVDVAPQTAHKTHVVRSVDKDTDVQEVQYARLGEDQNSDI